MDVSVSNKSPKYALVGFPDFFPDDPEIKLFYQKNDVNNQIKIFPQMEYLSKLERGEPISDLYGGGGFPYFDWQFPNLDLRIVNNTKETVYVTDIVLEVEESKIDPSAVLLITGEAQNLLHFRLVNEGWGEIKNGYIKFNLAPFGQPISFNEPYQHEVQLGKFSESYEEYSYNVNISKALSDVGVNLDILNYEYNSDFGVLMNSWLWSTNEHSESSCWSQIFGNEPRNEFCQSKLDALGIFSGSKHPENETLYVAVAYGEIFFTETTIEGKTRERIIKFETEVPLLDGGQYGEAGPPTYQYEAKLDVDRENYEVTVQADGSSVSQYLKSGDTDRFNILIGAEKSSVHALRLKLVYNNGQTLLSHPINLKIFVPRSQGKAVQGLETLIANESKFLAEYHENVDSSLDVQKDLIKNGKVNEAISIFEQAQKLNPKLEISAQAWGELCQTNNLWGYANELIDTCKKSVELEANDPLWWYQLGVAHAVKEEIDLSINSFKECLKLVSNITPYNDNQRVELQQIELDLKKLLKDLSSGNNFTYREVLLWQGSKLANQGEIKKALKVYAEVEKLEPNREISANSWNIICWNGSLYGYAVDVIDACEKAVTKALDDGLFRDSRGLARALTGQTDKSIEDFEAFILWIDNNLEKMSYYNRNRFSRIKLVREGWIDDLRKGKQPFTYQEIQKLFNENNSPHGPTIEN